MAGQTDAEKRAAEIRAKKQEALAKIEDDKAAQKRRQQQREAEGIRKAKLRQSQSAAAKLKTRPAELARKDSQDLLDQARRVSGQQSLAQQLKAIQPASDAAVVAFSEKLNVRLNQLFPSEPEKREWYRLFKVRVCEWEGGERGGRPHTPPPTSATGM